MERSRVYIWYSGATRITGSTLVERLGVTGGDRRPTARQADLVIGWGTKTKNDVTLPQEVVNHPNKIRTNRNKLSALNKMLRGDVPVAPFAEIGSHQEAIGRGDISFPMVGRTKFHQGGKGFWPILNQSMLASAISDGAQYVQQYIDVQDEYRLHVFDGTVIYAVRKVKREDPSAAFAEQYKEKILSAAEKQSRQLDNDTLDFALGRLAPTMVPHADMVVRSNSRGWRFSRINLDNVSEAMSHAAVSALAALELTFGAVDVAVDTSGNVWVLEVNSGPGLQETTLDTYVTAFGNFIDAYGREEEPMVQEREAAVTPVREATTTPDTNVGAKERMRRKLALMAELLELSSEEEVAQMTSGGGMEALLGQQGKAKKSKTKTKKK